MPSVLPPMWSNGEREGDGYYLKSFEAIYRSQPMVAGAVDKLARRIASLPFDGYRRMDDRAREMLERTDGLQTLVAHPMPGVAKVHLLAHVAQSLLIHGNALVAKLRGPDRDAPPIMLWPLDWARIGAYAEPGGRIEWWSTFQFGLEERFISAADTIHFAWPGPDGGEVGVSPLEKLGVTIQVEDAAQRYQTASFRNGNRPSLLIKVDQELKNPEAVQRFKDSINQFMGVDGTSRTLFLTHGADAKPLAFTPVETALIEQRKLNREEVGMVYDLAGPLMNDLTHGTYSNVEELNTALYRDVIPPWTALIEQTFQAQLIDREAGWLDRFVEFDLTDKLKGDPVALSQALKLQVESGLISRDEARRILNLPPVGGAAASLTANVNNQGPLEQAVEPVDE
jgi:HK97 family phage portal protein